MEKINFQQAVTPQVNKPEKIHPGLSVITGKTCDHSLVYEYIHGAPWANFTLTTTCSHDQIRRKLISDINQQAKDTQHNQLMIQLHYFAKAGGKKKNIWRLIWIHTRQGNILESRHSQD